ncbi:unnamed protein product [Rotaria magnacalcarata]|uniref:Uncharacterized protein n=2 Tax=Rotaria magnacalcarata TaxID=392030 RepID=A0A816ZBW6_9BILA|nr:unnamed protein product [Rotaria magnacalcarata]
MNASIGENAPSKRSNISIYMMNEGKFLLLARREESRAKDTLLLVFLPSKASVFDMGLFPTKNLPLQKFWGEWADGKGAFMVISPTGFLKYLKETPNSQEMRNGFAEYDEYGFVSSGCCMSHMEGNYYNYNGRQPVFIVNGDALKKQKPGSRVASEAIENASNSAAAAAAAAAAANPAVFVSPAIVAI